MKKLTLVLAAVFCFATATVNAQTYVGDLDRNLWGFIPGAFTTNGHAYVVYGTSTGEGTCDLSIYQNDFTTHVIDINNVASEVDYLIVENGWYDYVDFLPVTQSIFNDDDDFEYFQYGNNWQSFYVKSSNGSTLWSFNAEAGYYCNANFLKVEDKYYLLVSESNGNYQERRLHLYYISQVDGLMEIETELPISVFPSIANRGQQITVELGEGNNAKEITVVNSLGQVVKRVSVEEGQREVTIPTKNLGSGLNVVNTRTEQGQGSCKIIVR